MCEITLQHMRSESTGIITSPQCVTANPRNSRQAGIHLLTYSPA